MTRYYVVCVDGAGARERLDWTYNADEAAEWVKDYEREDAEACAAGAPAGGYSYEIVPEDEDEDEDGGGAPLTMSQKLREIGMSQRDFL